MDRVGDIVYLEDPGGLGYDIKLEILEVDPVDGSIVKMKAVLPDDRLGKVGFILEGQQWVTFSYRLSRN